MKENEIISILGQLGWVCGKDEAGDGFCILNVDGIKIQLIPTIRKASDHFRVSMMQSISTQKFTSAASIIFSAINSEGHEPIVIRNEVPKKMTSITPEDVAVFSKDAIEWAKAQNIEQGLSIYRSLPTDSKGARPLRHLAALAIANDVERLESYRQSFERGDRLGFVPYITLEMIERALLIARGETS